MRSARQRQTSGACKGRAGRREAWRAATVARPRSAREHRIAAETARRNASNQYRRYLQLPNLCTFAQPHTGEPGTREGERPARVPRATGAEASLIP